MELADQLSRAVAESQKSLTAALADNAAAIRTSVSTASEGLLAANEVHNRHLSEMATKTKEQIALLDTALAEELEKSLTSLGRQLTALSERFVNDYTPLTDKLRRVLDLAQA
jgi:uncharacterized protein YhaN